MPRVMMSFLVRNAEFTGTSDQIFQVGPLVTGLSLLNKPLVYINDAAGVATLFDPTGIAVPGATNITVTYESGSNGLYSGLIVGANFLPPSVDTGYVLVVSLQSPTQGNRQISLPAQVKISDNTDPN